MGKVQEVWSSNPWPAKSYTVLQIVRHRHIKGTVRYSIGKNVHTGMF